MDYPSLLFKLSNSGEGIGILRDSSHGHLIPYGEGLNTEFFISQTCNYTFVCNNVQNHLVK